MAIQAVEEITKDAISTAVGAQLTEGPYRTYESSVTCQKTDETDLRDPYGSPCIGPFSSGGFEHTASDQQETDFADTVPSFTSPEILTSGPYPLVEVVPEEERNEDIELQSTSACIHLLDQLDDLTSVGSTANDAYMPTSFAATSTNHNETAPEELEPLRVELKDPTADNSNYTLTDVGDRAPADKPDDRPTGAKTEAADILIAESCSQDRQAPDPANDLGDAAPVSSVSLTNTATAPEITSFQISVPCLEEPQDVATDPPPAILANANELPLCTSPTSTDHTRSTEFTDDLPSLLSASTSYALSDTSATKVYSSALADDIDAESAEPNSVNTGTVPASLQDHAQIALSCSSQPSDGPGPHSHISAPLATSEASVSSSSELSTSLAQDLAASTIQSPCSPDDLPLILECAVSDVTLTLEPAFADGLAALEVTSDIVCGFTAIGLTEEDTVLAAHPSNDDEDSEKSRIRSGEEKSSQTTRAYADAYGLTSPTTPHSSDCLPPQTIEPNDRDDLPIGCIETAPAEGRTEMLQVIDCEDVAEDPLPSSSPWNSSQPRASSPARIFSSSPPRFSFDSPPSSPRADHGQNKLEDERSTTFAGGISSALGKRKADSGLLTAEHAEPKRIVS